MSDRNKPSLSAPHLFDDEDYEGLTIIAFTPKSSTHLRTLTSAADDTDECNTTRLTSESSSSSYTLSLAPASGRSKIKCDDQKASNSSNMGSFLSNLTRGWSRVGKVQELDHSPSSVVASPLVVPCKGMRTLSDKEEGLLLRQAVFASIDGEDAREFQEFLDDDGGDIEGMPVLYSVEYGVDGSYASDIWVLMHNTVRRELFDVLDILRVVKKEFLGLRVEDVYEFRKWWRFFVVLWGEFWAHEKEQIDPLVGQICLVDGRSDALRSELKQLRDIREWLGLKMEEVTSYVEEFEKLRPGRALCLICKNVETFAARTIEYFSGVERLLPGVLEGYYGPEIRTEIDGALVKRIRGLECFPELIIGIVRWMEAEDVGGRVKDRWIGEHLFWKERQGMERFQKRYDEVHGRVVGYFRERLQNSDSL